MALLFLCVHHMMMLLYEIITVVQDLFHIIAQQVDFFFNFPNNFITNQSLYYGLNFLYLLLGGESTFQLHMQIEKQTGSLTRNRMILINCIQIKLFYQVFNLKRLVGCSSRTFDRGSAAFNICLDKVEMDPNLLIVFLFNNPFLFQHYVLIICNSNNQRHRCLQHVEQRYRDYWDYTETPFEWSQQFIKP